MIKMGVTLNIYLDHSNDQDELWSVIQKIPKDIELKNLLQELYQYEEKVGGGPKPPYGKWENEDFNNYEEFIKCFNDDIVVLRNSVFYIYIAKKGLELSHWTRIKFFTENEEIQIIFRKIVKHIGKIFNSNEVIYGPDSAYETELIGIKIMEGESFSEIKRWLEDEKIRKANSLSEINRSTKEVWCIADGYYWEKL